MDDLESHEDKEYHLFTRGSQWVVFAPMVVMTYKVNPESPDVCSTLRDDNYDIQAIETKPLAFGLKFVQVHVKMNDGEGLADAFEAKMAEIHGVAELKSSPWASIDTDEPPSQSNI